MTSLHTAREVSDMSDRHRSESDREISLGTSTLLGLFFALALVCSVFFGFGYAMGRKSVPPVAHPAEASQDHTLSESFKGFKPSPGGPLDAGSGKAKESTETAGTTAPSVVVPSGIAKTPVAAPPRKPVFDPDAEIVGGEPEPKAAPAPRAASTPATVVASPGTALVQVAAVSHQEDADVLLSALKRKGYSVSIRQEPQDRLLHVQLGPYASKKEAEAMRQRLLADGYNAILK